MDTVKSKMVNFIATNIPGTASLIVTVKKWDMLYFGYRFISDHITFGNYYCLLLLCQTKRY